MCTLVHFGCQSWLLFLRAFAFLIASFLKSIFLFAHFGSTLALSRGLLESPQPNLTPTDSVELQSSQETLAEANPQAKPRQGWNSRVLEKSPSLFSKDDSNDTQSVSTWRRKKTDLLWPLELRGERCVVRLGLKLNDVSCEVEKFFF